MKLLISQDFPPKEGGLSTWALELAKNFNGLDGPITVMARGVSPQNRACDRRLDFPIWRMAGHHWSRYGHLYVAYYLAKFLLTKGIIPIIYATRWNEGLVPALLAPLVGMKVIIGAHGIDVMKVNKPFRRCLIRAAFCRAHRGVAVSRNTRQALICLGVPQQKVVFVPNGVDVKVFHPREKSASLLRRYGLEDKKVILTLGRLVTRKGQDQVIRALPKVIQKVPQVAYLLAGQGPDEARLRSLARSLGLMGRVIFAGYVPERELVDHYNLADVYIMPSREIVEEGDVEGFGITFLEANACRVPVIGGRSGGIPDAISNGQTGLLIDPLDPDQIAEALVRLLTDKALARRLGQRGRQRVVRELQWSHIAKRLLELEREKS